MEFFKRTRPTSINQNISFDEIKNNKYFSNRQVLIIALKNDSNGVQCSTMKSTRCDFDSREANINRLNISDFFSEPPTI